MLIRPTAIKAGGTAQQMAQSEMKPAPYFANFAFRELFPPEQPQVGSTDPFCEQMSVQPTAEDVLVMLISFE